jgi:hypothetical protein
MAKKRFDCVEQQHRGGERVYEATKGMTREERLAWWQERNREFLAAREARRAEREKAAAAEP